MNHERDDTILMLIEMAHEFQTPLAILKGNIEILDENQLSRNKEMRKQAVRVAQETLDRLSRLVTNILKASQFTLKEEGAVQLPVNILSLVQDAYDDCALLAEEKGVSLMIEASLDAWTLGDKDLLRQVLLNILSNALKYTPTGGAIFLSATHGIHNNHQDKNNLPERFVEIIVSDSGVGIAPENIPRIFERFYRIPGNEHIKGTGLGLHICKNIIEAHSGTIEVASEVAKGSRFMIRLPELREKPGDASASGALDTPDTKRIQEDPEIASSAIINKCKTS